MAYAKKFYTSFKSYNGWDYYMEFFVKDFVGSATEISLGSGGPVISYDTDSEDRENPILASQMEIPFIVSNATEQTFIDDMRDTFAERDVYVHLYKSTAANTDALWSGFLLMDLSAKQDLYYPFETVLTATDGISLLKDADFVEDGATKPYGIDDVYSGKRRFTAWFNRIFLKIGTATTAEGLYSNPEYRTSVNWYNYSHTTISQANDPMYLTKCKVRWSYEKDDNGNYKVQNSYDVLKKLLRGWHCRLVYWNNIFWIIQIPEYITAESGTNAAPDNVNTRSYVFSSGSPLGNYAYLGTLDNARYELLVGENSPSPKGIQKLTGTKYQFYPRLKSVTSQFLTGGGENYYAGFPTFDGTTITSPFQQQTIVDAYNADNLSLTIPLNITMGATPSNTDITLHFRFFLKATNGTTTKYLEYYQGTYTWITSVPMSQPNDKRLKGEALLTPGATQQYIVFDETIPTDSSFTGAWDFELSLNPVSDFGSGDSSLWIWSSSPSIAGFLYDPTTFNISFANIPSQLTGQAFLGQFLLLNASSGLNIAGQTIEIETALSNSANFDFGEMMYGDTQSLMDSGSLEVYTGSAWVATAFGGQWGVGTLSGTETITRLLMEEYIRGQASNIQIMNARLMISETGRDDNDGTATVPNYVNPVGILRESITGDINIYVFKRGGFSLLLDEWDYEGWSIKDETPTTTATTTNTWSPYGPMEDDNHINAL